MVWMPYSQIHLELLPDICLAGSDIWRARVVLIAFNVVTMHVPDRVMAQFGMSQHIPEPMEQLVRVDDRVRPGRSWSAYHAHYITRWTERRRHVVEEQHLPGSPLEIRDRYLSWYWSVTKRWIQKTPSQPPMKYCPRGPLERQLV